MGCITSDGGSRRLATLRLTGKQRRRRTQYGQGPEVRVPLLFRATVCQDGNVYRSPLAGPCLPKGGRPAGLGEVSVVQDRLAYTKGNK